MTAIWQNDGSRWHLLAPTGFPSEAMLPTCYRWCDLTDKFTTWVNLWLMSKFETSCAVVRLRRMTFRK